MRLKQLELLGFKSFADKTKLQFVSGITAVVGPNGCGKSNIADAFRWVLGEQSAKSMRGNKMPDVIFAGTVERKPLNFAEVTITLSDIGDKLPIEYDEVAVTRRLHRSGESDYFINRHPVRLKDVQSLFLDSGMGKDAYSIFEQGKIDQVINFTPLERRYIFEEAAGILRFLQRKKEALRKLEQSDLNTSRIKDIHQEVERQIIVLEEQAEKARLYKKNKTILETLEKSFLISKWDLLQLKLIEIKEKGEIHHQNSQVLSLQLEAFITELKEAKLRLAEQEKILKGKSEEVFKARSEKEIKAKEKISNQERLKETIAKEQRWQQELITMIEKRSARQNERKGYEKKLAELESDWLQQEQKVITQRSVVQEIEAVLHKLRELQQKKHQEHLQLIQKQAKSENDLKQSNIRLENMQEKKNNLHKRKDVISKLQAESLQNFQEKQKQQEQMSKEIDIQRTSLEKMEVSLQEISKEINKDQADMELLQQELAEKKARQKVLLRLRDDKEGFSVGSKKLLQEAENSKSPFYKKLKGLYEYIIPESGYEEALASVMRPYAQTLVVETGEVFEEVIQFCKNNALKDYSLFCLESANQEFAKGLESLIEHVTKNPISSFFLEGIVVGKEIMEAFEILKSGKAKQVCTIEGELLDHRQVMFNASQGVNNVFIREAELKALEKKILELEKAKQELETILKKLQQQKNHVQTERIELDKTIRRGEMKLLEINYSVQRFNQEIEKAHLEMEQIETELKTLCFGIETLKSSFKELQVSYQEASDNVSSNQNNMAKLNEELQGQITLQKNKRQELQGIENVFQQVSEEKRKCQHLLHVLDVKDQESQLQEKRLEEEIENCQGLLSQINIKGSEFEKILHEVELSLADVVAACSEHEQEVAAQKSVIDHIEKKIEEKRLQLKKSETETHRIGVTIAQLDSNLNTLETECCDKHQTTIEELKKVINKIENPIEILEKEIRLLRQELADSGDINMTSIEECEKHKVRYSFLNQQIDDLNLSKKELVEIISQLDAESRKIFKETFDKISENFKKNFKILFSGGEADLQFTETHDVLEAGIEIIAKPPGKQMRSINLLSGGEKCLTALALLFAIFEVKPAPFCILDEIDAPLDDINVERFSNIVKQYIDRCQFIIITHNKRTMAIADILFGISMEEKGVSKLLAMEFSKQTEPVLIE